jgi:hypothetical protein
MYRAEPSDIGRLSVEQSTVCTGVAKHIRQHFPSAAVAPITLCARCRPTGDKKEVCRFKGNESPLSDSTS